MQCKICEQKKRCDDFYIGKYGETLHFTKIGGGYIFSSYLLKRWDEFVDELQKDVLNDSYCIKGVPDFDVADRTDVIDRAITLGAALHELYQQYHATGDETLIKTMKKIFDNVIGLKLNEEDYFDYFLTFGITVDKTYLSFIQRLSAEK